MNLQLYLPQALRDEEIFSITIKSLQELAKLDVETYGSRYIDRNVIPTFGELKYERFAKASSIKLQELIGTSTYLKLGSLIDEYQIEVREWYEIQEDIGKCGVVFIVDIGKAGATLDWLNQIDKQLEDYVKRAGHVCFNKYGWLLRVSLEEQQYSESSNCYNSEVDFSNCFISQRPCSLSRTYTKVYPTYIKYGHFQYNEYILYWNLRTKIGSPCNEFEGFKYIGTTRLLKYGEFEYNFDYSFNQYVHENLTGKTLVYGYSVYKKDLGKTSCSLYEIDILSTHIFSDEYEIHNGFSYTSHHKFGYGYYNKLSTVIENISSLFETNNTQHVESNPIAKSETTVETIVNSTWYKYGSNLHFSRFSYSKKLFDDEIIEKSSLDVTEKFQNNLLYYGHFTYKTEFYIDTNIYGKFTYYAHTYPSRESYNDLRLAEGIYTFEDALISSDSLSVELINELN